MVVAREVARDVVGTFEELHRERFPIRRMALVDAPGVIGDGDVVVRVFTSRGWEWGGRWTSPD